MKNLYSIFLLTIFSTTLLAQTTRRVNGDPNITGVNVYNTIQAAVDAANTDDVILIEPYGENLSLNPPYSENVTVDKRLHFRGNGYNLTNPLLTVIPLDTRHVRVTSLTFDIGSGSSTVSNIELDGMNIYSPNIEIESSKIEGALYFYSTESGPVIVTEGISPIVRKCIMRWVVDGRSINSITNSNLNMVLENSFVWGYISSSDNSIYKNCIIQSVNSVDNSVFTNCIFLSPIVGSTGGSNYNNAISYCLSFANDLPTLGNNINTAVWQQVFKGANYVDYNSFLGENDRVLSNSSIAKNAGINGGDIGIYGGAYPYELSGLPHHPISTFFINSGIGNNAIDIDAVITIKAN